MAAARVGRWWRRGCGGRGTTTRTICILSIVLHELRLVCQIDLKKRVLTEELLGNPHNCLGGVLAVVLVVKFVTAFDGLADLGLDLWVRIGTQEAHLVVHDRANVLVFDQLRLQGVVESPLSAAITIVFCVCPVYHLLRVRLQEAIGLALLLFERELAGCKQILSGLRAAICHAILPFGRCGRVSVVLLEAFDGHAGVLCVVCVEHHGLLRGVVGGLLGWLVVSFWLVDEVD